jgi:O-antigen ligase
MQNFATMGILRSLPAYPPKGNPWMTYARAATFTAWFFLLLVNYWWRQNWNDLSEMLTEGVDVKKYYYLGIGIAIAGHLTLGMRAWIEAPFDFMSTRVGKILTAFFLYLLLLTPLSVNFRASAIYLVATWGVLMLCTLFWMSDYQILRRVLSFTGIVVFAWLLILLFHHGMARGVGGTIGGINRNQIGKAALVGMICLLFATHKTIRWVGTGLSIGLLVLVTSRGTLLATGVFLSVLYALNKGTGKAMAHASLAMFFVAAVLLASTVLQQAIFEDVLRIHDEHRGVGSGLSGRVENWERGLERFWQRPLTGYGFRATALGDTSMTNVHSGYINLLVETGIIGTCLIVGAVMFALYERVRIVLQVRAMMDQSPAYRVLFADTFWHNSIAAATFCSVLVLWVYEPLYINLGQAMSLLFFLMLTSPLYPNITQRDLLAQPHLQAGMRRQSLV